MNNPKVGAFEKQAYLNLETYRKNGVGVPTPVWFAENQGVLAECLNLLVIPFIWRNDEPG